MAAAALVGRLHLFQYPQPSRRSSLWFVQMSAEVQAEMEVKAVLQELEGLEALKEPRPYHFAKMNQAAAATQDPQGSLVEKATLAKLGYKAMLITPP